MIDNLIGMARVFEHCLTHRASSDTWRMATANRLCNADMGAAAVQRHMPEWYHKTVAEARKWLRDQALPAKPLSARWWAEWKAAAALD